MPDPTMSQAIEEAYASAKGGPVYFTFEVIHPMLDPPLRVVYGNDDIEVRLEDDAQTAPGEIVIFQHYPLRFQRPKMDGNAPGAWKIYIDNVDREITDALEAAVDSGEAAYIVFRDYLRSNFEFGPENDPPVRMIVEAVHADSFEVELYCTFKRIKNKMWPTQEYDPEVWPGLVGEDG